jgi:hypothetical protein
MAIALLALSACKPSGPAAKEYVYPAWGFRASFPMTPVETRQPAPPNGAAPDADLVEGNEGGRSFAVWVADVSRTGMSLDELAKSAADHVAQGLGAKPGIPAYAATSEGVMGREYHLAQAGKWQASMRVYLTGGRFYEVIGKSALGEDDPALKAFLLSFHTLAIPPAGNVAANTATSATP